MVKGKVEQLFKEVEPLSGPGEQSAIFYYLYARIASGLEDKEEGSGSITKSIGQAWNEAAGYMDKVAKENPELALDLGLKLALLPRDVNSGREKVIRWMRGDGPIILAKENLRSPLLHYLSTSSQAPDFVEKIRKYMQFDMSGLTEEEAFSNPDCFLAVAGMYLGAKLSDVKDNLLIDFLAGTALKKLADPKVAEVIRYYADSEDTAWIVRELAPFLEKDAPA